MHADSLKGIAEEESQFKKKLSEKDRNEQKLRQALDDHKQDENYKMVQERKNQEEEIRFLLEAQKKGNNLRIEEERKRLEDEEYKIRLMQNQNEAKGELLRSIGEPEKFNRIPTKGDQAEGKDLRLSNPRKDLLDRRAFIEDRKSVV